MEQCFGILGMLFGNRSRKRRLKYMVKYKDDDAKNLGVEFENLVFDDDKPIYGTDVSSITREERELLVKREYDKIIEQQRKVDEQIDKKMFDEEEAIRVEEEAYLEAQKQAARAASFTLSLREQSADLASTVGNSSSRRSLTLDEVEDDFEDFLKEVQSRSIAFRHQYANNNLDKDLHPESGDAPPSMERGGDGMSSEEDFITHETFGSENQELEWDKFTTGLDGDTRSKEMPGTRLEPVGNANTSINKLNITKTGSRSGNKLIEAERMFSITDDEDMGDFVHG